MKNLDRQPPPFTGYVSPVPHHHKILVEPIEPDGTHCIGVGPAEVAITDNFDIKDCKAVSACFQGLLSHSGNRVGTQKFLLGFDS